MFSTYLRHVVSATAMKEDTWCFVVWKEAAESVTQADLDLAHSKAVLVKERLSSLGITSQRKAKSLERVKEKILERAQSGDYFKSVNDFIAFRVACDVGEIDEKLTIIEKLDNCVSCVRKCWSKDIVQYVYLYFEDIGFIVELQIGHPLALYTFEMDSLRRVGGSQVDLWENDFYSTTKDYILSLVDKTIPSCTKEEILEKARTIHNGTIPERLLSILNEL